MTERFTKDLRQRIVRDFAVRNNGVFNPALFLEEVRRKGESHPAHSWFEWDIAKAALAYQVEQARAFARDLRITFSVEEVGRGKPVSVRTSVMPLVISPVEGRRDGGGYFLASPDNPVHMAEHCRQAATALAAWLERYQAALAHVGCPSTELEVAIAALNGVGPAKMLDHEDKADAA